MRPTILIVEDYVDALTAWELLLRAEGFDVLTASTGDEALSCATSAIPAVVVLDLELPGLSGIEVARALRSQAGTRHIPLIATTGHSHMSELIGESGFDALMVKPCEPAALIAQIHRLIAIGQTPAIPEH